MKIKFPFKKIKSVCTTKLIVHEVDGEDKRLSDMLGDNSINSDYIWVDIADIYQWIDPIKASSGEYSVDGFTAKTSNISNVHAVGTFEILTEGDVECKLLGVPAKISCNSIFYADWNYDIQTVFSGANIDIVLSNPRSDIKTFWTEPIDYTYINRADMGYGIFNPFVEVLEDDSKEDDRPIFNYDEKLAHIVELCKGKTMDEINHDSSIISALSEFVAQCETIMQWYNSDDYRESSWKDKYYFKLYANLNKDDFPITYEGKTIEFSEVTENPESFSTDVLDSYEKREEHILFNMLTNFLDTLVTSCRADKYMRYFVGALTFPRNIIQVKLPRSIVYWLINHFG